MQELVTYSVKLSLYGEYSFPVAVTLHFADQPDGNDVIGALLALEQKKEDQKHKDMLRAMRYRVQPDTEITNSVVGSVTITVNTFTVYKR